MLVIESEIIVNSQVQDRGKYIKLELNFIVMMTRQQQTEEHKFILFEELFMQDISTKTLCNGESYESREKRHSQHKVWHPGEREKVVNAPAIEKGQAVSWKMKSDEVYNRVSGKTHEYESMNYFNLRSLMQEHYSNLITPMSLISHLLKGAGSLNHFIYFSKFI